MRSCTPTLIAVGQMTAPGDRLMTPELIERALAAAEH
jgi:hypothetical protein